MKKYLAAASTATFYLATVASVYAQGNLDVKLDSPIEGAGNIQLNNIPAFIVNGLFYVGIFLAIVYLLFGGIKWMTSGGDKAKVDSARKHIISAIVGLVVVVGTFAILRILGTILGVNISTDFCIPNLANPKCT